jgi:DNA replication protein DnaC
MENNKFGYDYRDAHLAKIDLPEECVNALKGWVDRDEGILFFAGNPGVGKTYFCAAYANYLKEKNKTVRYFTELSLFGHLREIIQKGWDHTHEINRLCECDYFILDDLGSARTENTPWQTEVLFTFLDNRSASRCPTIITSNYFVDQLKSKSEERFISRLLDKRNVKVQINWKDKRQES